MQLEALLKSLEQHQHAPTEKWNPPYCGEIPIRIDADGQWYYQDSPIKRERLIKLFASVLVCENKEYFLITPAEKVKISVADAPLVIVAWQQIEHDGAVHIQVTTNIGSRYPLSDAYPLLMKNSLPYVQLDHGLCAKVHRNVYYQWAELAELDERSGVAWLHSGTQRFALGQF